MGCVVVTEPFDLTVVGGRHAFNVPNRMQTHIGSICEPKTGGHIRDLLVAKGILVGTMHGFADTVRFRGRGLIVDLCYIDWSQPCHSRRCRDAFHVLFSARMQTQAAHMSTISFWGVSLRTRCERRQVRQRTWKTAKSLHVRSRQQYFMVACKRRAVRGLGS